LSAFKTLCFIVVFVLLFLLIFNFCFWLVLLFCWFIVTGGWLDFDKCKIGFAYKLSKSKKWVRSHRRNTHIWSLSFTSSSTLFWKDPFTFT
jgi:hypothetical protein